jgi:hypothetical protein
MMFLQCSKRVHTASSHYRFKEKISGGLVVKPILTQIMQYREKLGEHLQIMGKHLLPRTAW